MSYQGQAATITRELLTRLDQVADGRADRASVEQIKFSAQRLRNADRMEFLMVMGIAEALEGNVSMSDEYFDKAFAEFGLNQFLVINRYLVLSEQGRRAEGISLLISALDVLTDPESLEKALAVLGGAGYLSEASRLAERLDKMRGSSSAEIFRGQKESLEERGISEDDLKQAATALRERLYEIGYRRLDVNFSYDLLADWGSGLVHKICLDEPAERLYEIESRLNREMITANLKAVEEGAFIWHVKSKKGAPRAALVG